MLGLLEQEPEAFLQSGAQADDGIAEIEALIQQRLDARKAKDWAAADAARDRLNEMGIVLKMARRALPGAVSNDIDCRMAARALSGNQCRMSVG